jgi:hypothetical protein
MDASRYLEISISLIAVLSGLVGALYAVVRLAIRAEIAQLKNEISDRYVTRETCAACRRDCPAKLTLSNHLENHN